MKQRVSECFTKEFGFSCGSVGIIGDFKQRSGMIRFDFGKRGLVQMKELYGLGSTTNHNNDERE